MTILQILNELAADNSRLAKEKILLREKNNTLLQKVIKACLDPYINYWIKKIPDYSCDPAPIVDLTTAIDNLDFLAKRHITGNDAIEFLSDLLSSLSEDDAIVLARIIGRNLECAVGEPSCNKVWPGIIPTFDVMLAHKDTSGIVYPAISQCLSGDWKIETDSGIKTIKEIVDGHIDCSVLSFNFESKTQEFNKVTHWSKTKIGKKWYVITLSDGSVSPPLTGDHLVWSASRDEYVRVDELTLTDFVQLKDDG